MVAWILSTATWPLSHSKSNSKCLLVPDPGTTFQIQLDRKDARSCSSYLVVDAENKIFAMVTINVGEKYEVKLKLYSKAPIPYFCTNSFLVNS